jgi:hypothetical protein
MTRRSAEWSSPPQPFFLIARSIWSTMAVTGNTTPYSLPAAKAIPRSLWCNSERKPGSNEMASAAPPILIGLISHRGPARATYGALRFTSVLVTPCVYTLGANGLLSSAGKPRSLRSTPQAREDVLGKIARSSQGTIPYLLGSVLPELAARELGYGRFDQPLEVGVPDAHGVGVGAGPENYDLVFR